MDRWNISEAKAKFTQVVVSSKDSPQIICKRDKPVSAVIHIDLFRELMTLRENDKKPTIGQLLVELKQIRELEPGEIEIPVRRDRPTPFKETHDEMDL